MTSLYWSKATATGGREGKAATDDGKLELKLSTPKELGGPGGDGTNPEQLFACAYSACFLGAIKYVAGKTHVAVPAGATVTASVGVGPRDDGQGFGLEVTLEVSLPGLAQAEAEKLVQEANVVCPYSHATKGNIPVRLSLV